MTTTESRDAAFDEVRKDIYKETARYTIADDDERRTYFNAGIAQRDKEYADREPEIEWVWDKEDKSFSAIHNGKRIGFAYEESNGEWKYIILALEILTHSLPFDELHEVRYASLESAKLAAVKQLKELRNTLNGIKLEKGE